MPQTTPRSRQTMTATSRQPRPLRLRLRQLRSASARLPVPAQVWGIHAAGWGGVCVAALLTDVRAQDATAASGTQPDKKVKVEPKVGAKQKAVKKAGAGGGFDGAPAKRAPARSACEGTDAAPATDSAQPLPAEQGSKAARKSSLAGAKDAPTPTKSKTRGTSDGKAASESVQPSKEKRKRGDKAGAAQADGKSADAHVAVVDASTTAAKSAGTPDAALEKPAKERKRETPDSSDARENRATRSNAKATRSQDSARTPSPTERAAAGSAKGTGGKDKAAPKAGKAAKAARKPAVKEAASLDAGLLSRKRSRLSRADATAAAGSPGSEAGGALRTCRDGMPHHACSGTRTALCKASQSYSLCLIVAARRGVARRRTGALIRDSTTLTAHDRSGGLQASTPACTTCLRRRRGRLLRLQRAGGLRASDELPVQRQSLRLGGVR